MSKKGFLDSIRAGDVLVADGATGTNLQQRGLELGKPGETWVLDRPQEIIRLHRDFIDAGSKIILTCTFGGTPIRLAQEGLGEKAVELNQRAVALAQEAAQGKDTWVAGSIGPTGQMLKPLGTMTEEACYQAYEVQARALSEAGVDLLLIETQYDLAEASLAVRAVRAVSGLPLVCSFSYDRGLRTMMGVKPTQMVKVIGDLGVDLLGINCGRSLDENQAALTELRAATTLPIWFKPNAGLPRVDSEGKPVYDVIPAQMGEKVDGWIAAGANVVGGCCGSNPEHVRQIAGAAQRR